jgi:hypothetical protein
MGDLLKVRILYYKDGEQFEKLYFDKDGKSAYDFAEEFIDENKGKVKMKLFVNTNEIIRDISWKCIAIFTTMKCHTKEV